MVQIVPGTSQSLLIIYLLVVLCVPNTISYKIFSKRGLFDPLPSGCPFSLLGGTLNSALNLACETLGNVFFNITPPVLDSEEIRPESGYYFVPPNITADPPDQRGPCPGLNLLANYGYLPRNGIVTFEQSVNASVRGFNMGVDTATLLTVAAVVLSGNIITKKYSIGAPDVRVGIGNTGGSDKHNAVESDISPNREDYYTGNCDNHHLSSRLFKQNVQFAQAQGGLFNLNTMISQYAQHANDSKANNPYLSYGPVSFVVSLGAHVFYPYLMSNGTYELGGKPDYVSISNIVGANLTVNGNNYDFQYIPERWPETNNTAGKPWYRRKSQLTFPQVLSIIPQLYLANPVAIPFGQLNPSNLSVANMACAVYLALLQMTPIIAAQTEQNVFDALTWVITQLDPMFSGTTFGCPANSFTPNSGNFSSTPGNCTATTNQYNRTYFPTTP